MIDADVTEGADRGTPARSVLLRYLLCGVIRYFSPVACIA